MGVPLSFSWTARELPRVEHKLIQWEATSGLENKGRYAPGMYAPEVYCPYRRIGLGARQLDWLQVPAAAYYRWKGLRRDARGHVSKKGRQRLRTAG